MKNYRTPLFLLFSLSLSIFLSGCGTVGSSTEEKTSAVTVAPPPQPVVKGSGYLRDYMAFKPSPEEEGLFVFYRDGSGRVFRSYDGFIMEDIVVFAEAESNMVGFKPAEMGKLAEAFDSALRNELKAGGYHLATKPEPGVLIVRIALVGVKPINIMTDSALLSNGATVIEGTHLDVGHLAVEVEFIDSRTGERQVAYVDQTVGKDIDVIGGKATWEHVKTAFENWAQNFKHRLNEIHQ